MLIIREYERRDRRALLEIHARQRLGYELPDLDHPILPVKLVAEEDGKIQMGALLRLTAEAYMIMDRPAGLSADREAVLGRWVMLQAMHEAMREAALRIGLQDAHAFLMPQISKRFGAHLEALGWQRSPDAWMRDLSGGTWPKT